MLDLILVWGWGFVLGIVLSPEIRTLLKWLLHPLKCKLGLCGGRIVSTDHGLAWHCATCGKVSGWMSNKTIRESVEPKVRD